jgi:membrane protein
MRNAKQTDVPWLSFARFLLHRMAVNRVMQVAGSLTFTSLLAMVPLLIIALTVISAMPMFADYSTRFKFMLLSTLVPEFAGKILTVYMRQFADNAEKLTAVGVLMLGATSLMLMATIERTFNAIWGVARSRNWLQQGVIYWSVLTLGPAVLGGCLLFWHNLFKTSRLVHHAPLLAGLLQSVGAVALTAASLSLLYRFVPNRFVPVRHACWGALLTALLLELAKVCFGIYIQSFASFKLVYGAFSSIPIVLVWVYCLWLVVLAGAVFTCALSYWDSAAWSRQLTPHRRLLDAVQLLIVLDQAHQQGVALTPFQLRNEVHTGYDELEGVLDLLAAHDYVQKGRDDGWVLMKALPGIPVAELFMLFVDIRGPLRQNPVDQQMDILLQPLLSGLQNVSIADFARSLEPHVPHDQ